MVMDTNPTFGKDRMRQTDARRVSELLWQTTGGDFSKVPSIYLESLGFEYSDGTLSILDQLSKVDFGEGTTFEEFSEVVDKMIRVDPNEWPYSESILSIQKEKLLYEIESDFNFAEGEFDFAAVDNMSDKVELFLKKVISSVYRDGVSSVTDSKGNPPNAQNNYLLSDDGNGFSGVFYDTESPAETKKFPFEIREGKSGQYEISY